MKHFKIGLGLWLCLAVPATASTAFFENGFGIRSLGMGGTAVSTYRSAESALWGLPSEVATASFSLENGSVFGVPYWAAGWVNAFDIPLLQVSYVGSMQSGIARTALSEGGIPVDTGETFGAQFHRLGATWTIKSFEIMRMGVTATGFFESIDAESAFHPSVGLTIMEPGSAESPWSWLLGISDIFSFGHRWTTGRVDPTIRHIRFGGMGPLFPQTTATLEFTYTQTGPWLSQPFRPSQLTLSGGAEILLARTETMRALTLRTGLKDVSGGTFYTPQWTAGVGMQFQDWQLDYAYVLPLGPMLEPAHRFEVTAYFATTGADIKYPPNF